MKNIFYKIGNFIQRIIIKNILLFITLGFIKWGVSLFPQLFPLSEIFTKYAIPLSIGYTTGNEIDKKHGGISGIIGTVLIISTVAGGNILEVILISFLVSSTIKIFKEKIISRTIPGFEMIIINFSVPLISIGYYFIFLNIIPYINMFFREGTDIVLKAGNETWGIIVFTFLIEISKVFFINNFINHGFLAVMGYKELLLEGNSIFFLLETNPGPGLGVLLAFYIFYKEKRKNIFSNIVIEFFGGIHEVYFTYILKNLKLITAVIFGGLAGNLFFSFFKVRLSGIPSPGSIILITLLSSDTRFYLLAGVFLSVFASFVTAYTILARQKEKNDIKILEPYEITESIWKNEKATEKIFNKNILIYILCSGGMGSSSIGKTILKNLADEQGLKNVKVLSSFVGDEICEPALIITHRNFENKVKKIYPESLVFILEDYTDKNFYREFTEKYLIKNEKNLTENKNIKNETAVKEFIEINLGLKSVTLEESINFLGEDFGDEIKVGKNILAVYKKENVISEKIIINQYPYRIKESEIFLVIGICSENPEFFNKITEEIKKLSKDLNFMSELEISDEKEDFTKIFKAGENHVE